jgi:hypothetical protein
MSRIRIGDDLKAYLKNKKQEEDDMICFKRVRTLKDLPHTNETEDEVLVYELDCDDGRLYPIFLLLMHDSERIYVDHKPDDPELEKFECEPGGMPDDGLMTAQDVHDEQYTEYADYDDAEHFFSQNPYFVEVKK